LKAGFDHVHNYVEFERDFKALLAPWTESDLKLKCHDCDVESEDVEPQGVLRKRKEWEETVFVDLCPKCCRKRPDKDERYHFHR
jgi:hypothetical protein